MAASIHRQKRGPLPGTPQRGRNNRPAYTLGSAEPYRVSALLQPAEAEKFVRAVLALPLSQAGVLNELIRRMEVDDDGRPTWADELDDQEAQLPISA